MIEINPKGDKAWVTFSIKPREEVTSVAVAGDWNDWEPEEMHRKKDGTFYKRKQLLLGKTILSSICLTAKSGNSNRMHPKSPTLTAHTTHCSNSKILSSSDQHWRSGLKRRRVPYPDLNQFRYKKEWTWHKRYLIKSKPC